MRSLILFRHGKSDWDAKYQSDHERPLSPRGLEASACMGRLLAANGQLPDLAVTSSAIRAADSLQLAASAGQWPCPIHVDKALYNTTPKAVLKWIRGVLDEPRCLLLTGHEPTWSQLGGQLIGRACLRIPTGAMLRIDCDIDDWRSIRPGQGELRWLLTPKTVCVPRDT